jgi:transposase
MSVDSEHEEEDDIGIIQFGYSKDQRSNLKKLMISLMTSRDGDVPLLVKTITGNSSDKSHFKERLALLKEQIESIETAYFVADSTLYSTETIQTISVEIPWITRVSQQVSAISNS